MNLPILVCDPRNSINDLGDVQRVTSYIILPSIISYQINVVVYWFFSYIVICNYINYMLIAILNLMQIQK